MEKELKENMVANLLVNGFKTGCKYNTVAELFEAMDKDENLKRDFIELVHGK